MIPSSLRQFFFYFIFSGLAAIFNIGSRYFLSSLLIVNFTIAVTTAYCLGMIVNYLLNKYRNFPRGPRRSIHEIRTFFIVALFGLLLTNILAHFFVVINAIYFHEFGSRELSETIAHVSAVGLTAIYSFFGHKYFTYREGIRVGLEKILRKSSL